MIIELSNAFEHHGPAQWATDQAAIEQLINAHANGWHLLSMSRATAAAILNYCELSSTQRTILRDLIVPRLTTIISQGNSIKRGVLCVPDQMQLVRPKNRVPLPISYFSNPNAIQPAYIIVESIEGDGAFVRFLCEHFGKGLGFSSGSSLTFLAGGGGSTANRYREVANSGRAVLCVVDSDRLYPEGRLGQTASAVRAVQGRYPIAEVFMLPVREMENLIPHSALVLVYETNAAVRAHVLRLQEFIDQIDEQRDYVARVINGHFDVKEGVSKSFIRKVDVESASVWKALYQYLNPGEADLDLDGDDDAVVVAPISPKAIASTIDYFTTRPHRAKSLVTCIRNHSFRSIVEDLVTDVLSLTAAADRVRTPLRIA